MAGKKRKIIKVCNFNLQPAPNVIEMGKVDPILWNKWTPSRNNVVPTIFLHKIIDFSKHVQGLIDIGANFYQPYLGTNYTRIICKSYDDHFKMMEYFDDKELPYHTFGYPWNRKMKVVLRGLPKNTDLNSLKLALKSAGIPVIRMHEMYVKEFAKTRDKIILLLVLPLDDNGKKILKIKKIFDCEVTMEPPKRKVIQCHRCQRWGHAQRYCYGQIRCVKCAGEHFTRFCKRDRTKESPTCANCGGDHTASYRECFYCPESHEYKRNQSRRNNISQSRINVINPIPRELVTLENIKSNLYRKVKLFAKSKREVVNKPKSFIEYDDLLWDENFVLNQEALTNCEKTVKLQNEVSPAERPREHLNQESSTKSEPKFSQNETEFNIDHKAKVETMSAQNPGTSSQNTEMMLPPQNARNHRISLEKGRLPSQASETSQQRSNTSSQNIRAQREGRRIANLGTNVQINPRPTIIRMKNFDTNAVTAETSLQDIETSMQNLAISTENAETEGNLSSFPETPSSSLINDGTYLNRMSVHSTESHLPSTSTQNKISKYTKTYVQNGRTYGTKVGETTGETRISNVNAETYAENDSANMHNGEIYAQNLSTNAQNRNASTEITDIQVQVHEKSERNAVTSGKMTRQMKKEKYKKKHLRNMMKLQRRLQGTSAQN